MNVKYHFNNDYTREPRPFNDLLLYQIGEMLCIDGSIEPHIHGNLYEFTYILSGEGYIFANTTQTKVGKGDLFLSTPYELHKIISSETSPLRYCFLAFQFIENSPMDIILKSNKLETLDEHSRLINNAYYGDSFHELFTEIQSTLPYTEEYFEYLLKAFVLRVIREFLHIQNTSPYCTHINNSKLLCFSIINYINDHLIEIDSLSNIAKDLNYNYAYLSRVFQNTMGQTISSYYIDKKLERAKQLLEENQLSIVEIVEKLQYSSLYVFSKTFKKKYGISPREYRHLYISKIGK
jgi:AraC-like DNA-binding protein